VSGRLLQQMLCLILFATLCAAGCAGMRVAQLSNGAHWSGMGVSLHLPDGSWEVEEVDPGYIIEFRQPATAAHLVLLRLPAPEAETGALALKRLFVHFENKQEMARWSKAVQSGDTAHFADYLVTVDGRNLSVQACVVRRGAWTYELVTWGLDRTAADTIANSLVFAGESR